jgi:hypothetical protein
MFNIGDKVTWASDNAIPDMGLPDTKEHIAEHGYVTVSYAARDHIVSAEFPRGSIMNYRLKLYENTLTEGWI